MKLDRILSDIFDRNMGRKFASVEAERAAIAAAKNGDEEATVELLYAYSGVLRYGAYLAAHASFTAPQAADVEDDRANALMGVLAAIQAFDPAVHDRLAAIVKQHVAEHVGGSASDSVAFSVPTRTLSRFYSILRMADGDVELAASLAPDNHMSRETFFAVLGAVRSVDSLDELTAGEEAPSDVAASPLLGDEVDELDAFLVEVAFEAVDDTEEAICRLAYGFETYGEPVPDVEVAHRLEMTRPTVQRKRGKALGKMRYALALDAEAPADEAPKAAPFRLPAAARLAIAKRDGWICQICHKPIRPSAVSGIDPDALEIDHITPQSAFRPGQEALRDHPSNLRAAHRACNAAKSGGAYAKTDEAVKRLDLIPTVRKAS